MLSVAHIKLIPLLLYLGLAFSAEAADYLGKPEQMYDNSGQLIWDAIGRPVEQIIGHGGSTKHQRRYQWGLDDRLQEIIDSTSGTTKFIHDERGYLTATAYSNGTVQYRNPDAVGNLFETTDRKDRQYGNGGRLLKKGSTRYEYDLEGNLIKKITTKGSWHYHWNAAGMLKKVIRPDKQEATFAYDALGRRLFKKFKRTITNFVWDGNVPLHEFKTFDFHEGEVEQLITWIFENNSFVPAAKLKNGKEYSIQTDHLGTPNRVYDNEGKMVWLSDLDSYGNLSLVKGESGICPFRYQGQYFDQETGLCYNHHRYFDPEDGCYISQDPIRLASGEMGLYNYVHDPTVWIDPFGLSSYKPKVVRRFMSKKEFKAFKKRGFKFDPKDSRGGISATSTNMRPKNPDKIKGKTGALGADYYVDLDVTNKNVELKGNTKSGWPDYKIKDDVSVGDIVSSGRVGK